MARILLRDLTPGAAYELQFRADSGDDVSEWSQKFSLTTTADLNAPDVPAWAPTSALVADGTAFIATWQPLNFSLDGNKDFDHYELELSAAGKTFVFNLTNTFFTLTFEENNNLWITPTAVINARVRAVDLTGNASAWSSSIQATNPTPAAPATITAVPATDQVSLKWDASTSDDVIGYKVFTGSTAGFVPSAGNKIFEGNALSYTYSTTTYTGQWFKVVAVDVFKQESTTPTATGASVTPVSPFVIDTTPPVNPVWTSATLTNNANGIGANAALVWTQTLPNPNDLAGFEIRFREGTNPYTSAGTFDATVLSATVAVPKAFTAYEFSIRSFDKSRNYSGWVVTTASAVANTAPSDVTGLTATPGKDSITYNWTPVADTDIKNYEVTFSTSSTFASGNLTFLTGSSTTLTVGGLTPSTPYYARVRAVDNGGLNSAGWSPTNTSATTAFPAATSDGYAPQSSPTPSVSTGLGYLYATWTPVTLNSNGGSQVDPVTYEVHLSTTSGFTPSAGTKVTEVSGTFALIDVLPGTTNPLVYGTTYFVRLIAKDRDGAAVVGTQGSGVPTKLAAGDSNLTASDVGAPTTAQFNTAVKTYANEYYLSTSESTQTGGTWSTTPPTRTPGTYIWTRTTVTYQDNNTSVTSPVLTTGNTGNTGAAGTGITGTVVDYQVGNSGTTAPVGTWVSTPQATSPGQYLWTRTITSYSSGGPTTAYSVSAHGSTGTNGIGISGTVVEYQVGTSGTVAPVSTWSSTPVATTAPGQYLWTRTTTSYTSGSPTIAYAISAHGATGNTGGAGAPATAVDVGNDSIAIPTTTAGAALAAGTITIPFSGWTGPARAAATVAVSGLPAGITQSSNTAATTGADGSLVLAYANGATIGAADTGNIILTITCNGLTFTRLFSWSRAYQGATGATGGTGGVGTSATSLDSTPDNLVIPTDSSGNALASGNVVVTLKGLVGATASNVTIGAAPTLPAGITATPAGSGGTSAQITFSWNSGANIGGAAASGTFVWPITVNTIVFNKTIGWARASAGATGGAGGTGRGVTSITPYFAQVTIGSPPADPSGATPSAPWQTTEPTYVGGTELWRSDKILYTDATYAYTTKTKVSSYDAAATAITAANGKNKITHSTGTPGTTANTIGDTWIQVDDFTNNRIIAQWRGAGGTSWVSETIRSEFIAYLDAQKISANSTFTNNLNVKSTFTLGDVSTPGIIKSYDYNQSTKVGFSLGSNGLEIWNGKVSANTLEANTTITNNLGVTGVLTISSAGAVQSGNYNGTVGWQISALGAKFLDSGSTVAADAIKTGTLGASGSASVIQVAAGSSLVFNSGHLRSNTYTNAGGTPLTVYSPSTATSGWYLGSDGLHIVNGAVKASTLTSGDLATPSITLSGTAEIKTSGYNGTSGFRLSAANGLEIPNNSIAAAKLIINATDANNIIATSTVIDGGKITTGIIQSTNTVVINGVTERVWQIPLNGAATFSAMRVLGNTVLGNGPTDTASLLSSSNYSAGAIGWQFRADGTADLRGLTADSIDGKSIVANTLSVTTLNSNDPLGAAITLGNSGSLTAVNTTTGAIVGISGTEGFFVRGPIPAGQEKGPTYISFPILPDADGNTAPNIISGQLTATTVSVSGDSLGNAMTLFKNNFMEISSSMTLRNQTAASVAAPTASPTWAYTGMTPSGTGGTYPLTPFWPIGTTNTYGAIYSAPSGSQFTVKTFNSSGTQLTTTNVSGLPSSRSSFSVSSRTFKSAVQVGTNWYVLAREQQDAGGSPYAGIYIYVYNSSWVYQTNYTVYASQPSNTSIYQNYINSAALGTDGTQLLLVAQTGTTIVVTPYTTGGVAGTPVDTGINAANHGAYPYSWGVYMNSIHGTSADWGTPKWVIAHGNNGNVIVTSTTGVYDANSTFPTGKYAADGVYWNPASTELRFIATTTGMIPETSNKYSLIRYSKIDWTTETSRWSVATTRYNSSGNQESVASAQTFFTMQKRAWYSVTSDAGGATGQRVYVGRAASGDVANTALWRQDPAMVGSGITTTTKDTVVWSGSNPGTGSSPFPSSDPNAAKILSQAYESVVGSVTTTNASTALSAPAAIFVPSMVGTSITGSGIPVGSVILSVASATSATMSLNATASATVSATINRPLIELRGNGYARIKEVYSDQALFASNIVADGTAGNKPALRIGNVFAQHLRVSDDRLVAMTNDNTQGTLFLNYGGETRSTMMVLESVTDASVAAGNKPALRIGSTTGTHLRIDNNEIVAMLGDTGQGTLFLNQAGDVQLGTSGGRVKLSTGDFISGYARGNTTKTTDANGEFNIPHGLGGTPVVANLTTGTSQQLQVWALTGTNISVRVRSAAGAIVGSGVSVQVFWTAWL